MAFSEFDKAMKELEWYRGENLPKGVWPILRIDGRSFTKVTSALGFKKPYDQIFHQVMTEATKGVMKSLDAIYGYHQSDEISVLLAPNTQLFDRRAEKLVSVAAGIASAVFNREMPPFGSVEPIYPHFDARLICPLAENEVVSYFIWRQQDATRNALNSWCHWTAIQQDGLSATRAASLFHGHSVEFKNEYLFRKGTNFNDLPLWQRRGTAIYWEEYLRQGFNPKTQQAVEVSRWKLTTGNTLPMGDGYREFLGKRLSETAHGRWKQMITHG